ncbi:MAG: tetratricopeptide repeat protein [Planctomycetes bacterium]|nr:tetratricopeptide repeat protein [Planctomycetota bacterium]
MELRKEPLVFAGTVLVLGGLAWSTLSDAGARRGQPRRADPPAAAPQRAPDVALALPAERAAKGRSRDLFSPPSDFRPLAPLAFEPPPHAPLDSLAPPPVPGPEPRLWGQFLRAPARTVPVPGLFDAADEELDAEPAAGPPPTSAVRNAALSPEELAARLSAWKRTYDWFRIGEYRFGQIQNPDRFRLAKRPDEDLLFIEFDPVRGQPKFPGQAPMVVPRKTIAEFDFAATVQNELERRRLALGDPLSAAEYDQALSFARWCIERRFETPRALEVAAEIYERASRVLAQDPEPKLGLARVHEAAFRFEEAFQIYRALLAGPLRGNPLVLVRLGELQARFRLFAEAEASLRQAERSGRTSWQAQEALGRFLLERGRGAEAVEHYRLANQFEPTGAEDKHDRARVRAGLGAALLAVGEVPAAVEAFERALQAEASSEAARAGLAAARVLAPGATTAPSAAQPAEGEALGFDLLLARGVELARAPRAEAARAARAALRAAAARDPLRAHLAQRALSWLAEATGHPDEALRHVDLALEGDPTDPWAHFQRGRLLVARDDLDGGAESLRAALGLDADFADALAWMGDVALRRGDLAGAERYLERAVALDPTLVRAAVLRGVALLEAGSIADAEPVLRRALARAADDPAARGGLAWVQYRIGETTEALTRLAELDDARRAFPEDDPWRVWARRQIERLGDHLEKVLWSDGFERNALGNAWSVQESHGPLVSIHDGVVSLGGTFKSAGRSRLWQLKNAGDVVSLEARLVVRAGTTARVGIFISRESERGGETQVEAEATLSRHPDAAKNAVQFRAMKRGEEDRPQVEVPGVEWRFDQPVVLRLERVGAEGDVRIRASLDGIPVTIDTPLSALGRTNNPLRLGIFAEGAPGRSVQVDVDDVEIVFRRKTR